MRSTQRESLYHDKMKRGITANGNFSGKVESVGSWFNSFLKQRLLVLFEIQVIHSESTSAECFSYALWTRGHKKFADETVSRLEQEVEM